jgi:hypothetical protein
MGGRSLAPAAGQQTQFLECRSPRAAQASMVDKTPSIEDSQQRIGLVAETVSAFAANLDSVKKLLNFDREVVDLAVQGVRALPQTLVQRGFENPALNAKNTLTSLQNIKDHDSLLPRYKVVFNQAVVLLVSYFGSAVEELFKIGVSARLVLDDENSTLMKEELKLTFRSIRERGWMLNDIAADLLVDKKDLTFQDMKSIADAFRDYVGIEVTRNKIVNDIIVAQACRHVIVHAGHEVTSKMMRQIRGAIPRDLKPDLVVGEMVQFTPSEVELVAESMKAYVTQVAEALRGRV